MSFRFPIEPNCLFTLNCLFCRDILNTEKESVLKKAAAVPLRPEERALIQFINRILSDDAAISKMQLLPIGTMSADIEDACRSGVVLCKLINWAKPGTIDERAINMTNAADKPHLFSQNHMLCLNSASAIGCKVFRTFPNDETFLF